MKIDTGPTLVRVPLMLHVPTEALNADRETNIGGMKTKNRNFVSIFSQRNKPKRSQVLFC